MAIDAERNTLAASTVQRHSPPAGKLGDGNNCCGKPLEPRLARMRDRRGEMIFVAVWCCRRCGRVVAQP
jgi:hypothetical protein